MLTCIFLSSVLFSITSFANKTILVVGDSLSAAYRMDQEDGWVALLGERLDDDAECYQVVNASIVGDTTSGGLNRLPNELEKSSPSIVIIELGGNDGLRGASVHYIKDNITKMIDLSRQHGAKVLLLGIQIPPNYGPEYTKYFNQIFTETKQTDDVVVVPFLLEGIATKQKYMQLDGIHPNKSAQPLILDNVWKKLEPMLQCE